VRAYHHTYGLPVLTTNCSNNYGPLSLPREADPADDRQRAGRQAAAGVRRRPAGARLAVRGDHCSAIRRVLEAGRPGRDLQRRRLEREAQHRDRAHVCALLDELRPADGASYAEQITYVKDRPGHDRRYAIDARKIERELGWKPAETFDTGIRKTVQWYLAHGDWVQRVQSGAYREWVEKQYARRPGCGVKILLFGQWPGRLGTAAQPRAAG
jgi:dTDP-glucose 4,6-dehydratase